ncbi:LysM peptidoglycan-binding domain-containing protein [Pseudactinotalea sp. HY158]|nr:LysM peptidoglycan-binding domain-containing protein [Pseudactinotalea sp. HY158]
MHAMIRACRSVRSAAGRPVSAVGLMDSPSFRSGRGPGTGAWPRREPPGAGDPNGSIGCRWSVLSLVVMLISLRPQTPVRQTYVRTACRHRPGFLLSSYKRTTNGRSRGTTMSVLASTKPHRAGRPLPAAVPQRGPRPTDPARRSRRAHMVLLPEWSESPERAEDRAPGRGSGAGDVAARLPIRSLPHRSTTVPATAPVTTPLPTRAPVEPRREAAPAVRTGLHQHVGEALSLVVSRPVGRIVNRPVGRIEPTPTLTRAPARVPSSAPRSLSHAAATHSVATHSVATHSVAASPARRRSFSQLTVRGQRVLVGAGFALAVGLGSLVGGLVQSGGDVPAATDVVTVESGESLWQIAGAVAEPGADLRPLMEEIRALNSLDGSALTGGQSLLVPVAAG